ncbi:MAG: TPM domain-containing protein [Thermodesulfobacteriota bacterium]
MDLTRILKHLLLPQWRVQQAFPKSSLKAIELAVMASETDHDGELRFAIEGGLNLADLLRGMTARQRAVELFARLRVWDTAHNSGVLIYVQLADRRVEILADRGINQRVGAATWQRICGEMQKAFGDDRFEAGAVAGVRAVGKVLAEHFPARRENPDELPDAPVVL